MLLRDLLAVPELRLEVLYAPPGALDRVARRAYATDLLRPVRYLSPGDLVVTGLVWRRSPDDSEVFVSSLVEGKAAALAAGDALLGSIPGDVIGACRRHGLPLIEVPTEVSFADVIEHLMAAATAERGERLSASLSRQRALLAEAVAGRSLADLAARMSDETGHACRVLTPTGRHIVAGPSPLAAADVDRVTATFLTAPRLPAAAAGPGAPYSVFTVGQGLASRLTTWFVVVEGNWPDWDPAVVEAVAEFTSIAALDRSRQEEGQRAVRHIAGEAVALADSGGGQPEVGMRLRQLGLDPDQPVTAVAAGFPGRPDLAGTIQIVLADVASWFAAAAVAGCRDGSAVALLPAGPDTAPIARSALRRLAPGAARTPLAAGISASSMPGALAGALAEARYARRLAELRGGPVSVVAADEVTSSVLLLATVPDEVRRTFAFRVLGPVLDYDERNAAGLRRTLQAFLDCSGSWRQVSELLHLHVNTVRYRIGRVEQLTGRDLSRLEDQVDLFLALRSL
ncbi:MAG: PucR family transcriptional regulator ligand-binding domain-containing protein [Actinobacteria bacterium]|nr:PucR family transcriptional regulator ligand-binding domain-containing protein [Actinomycetota bacterium]